MQGKRQRGELVGSDFHQRLLHGLRDESELVPDRLLDVEIPRTLDDSRTEPVHLYLPDVPNSKEPCLLGLTRLVSNHTWERDLEVERKGLFRLPHPSQCRRRSDELKEGILRDSLRCPSVQGEIVNDEVGLLRAVRHQVASVSAVWVSTSNTTARVDFLSPAPWNRIRSAG